MSIEKVRAYFEGFGIAGRIREFDVSSATVELAAQAAGVIHTDFERGFIRAQTISYDDYIAYKGEKGAQEAGKMRAEGKDYVVADGDVMNFLFNV